jgi:hypothetical protein
MKIVSAAALAGAIAFTAFMPCASRAQAPSGAATAQTSAPATPPSAAAYYALLDKLPQTADDFYNYQGEFSQALSGIFAAAPLWTEDHTRTYKIDYTSYSLTSDADGTLHIQVRYTLRLPHGKPKNDEMHIDTIHVRAKRITVVSVDAVSIPGFITSTREAYRIVLTGPGRVTPFEIHSLKFRRGDDPAKSEAEAIAKDKEVSQAVASISIAIPCSDQQGNALGRTFAAYVLKQGGFASFHAVSPFTE